MSYRRFKNGTFLKKVRYYFFNVCHLYTYNANLFELFEVAGRTVHLRQKVTK